jgi:23S rRNA (guanine745-N1)-methyltransferase
MLIRPMTALVCPHDGSPLVERGTSMTCARGHTFDRAREGYVNLLPVQDKASRDPGDSKEMVAARRNVLGSGAYNAIAEALADAVLQRVSHRSNTQPYTILDAGCGEGFYLASLASRLAAAPPPTVVELAAIDISKWAIRAAAKRNTPATCAVASNRQPPFPPASLDLILCLFGFPIWEGFAMVQAPGAEVLLIDPGPDHLLEMREIIYPEVRRTSRNPMTAEPGYSPASETNMKSRAHLATPAAIAALLSMTPHAHRATADGRARLAACTTLDITLDITLRRYVRDAG